MTLTRDRTGQTKPRRVWAATGSKLVAFDPESGSSRARSTAPPAPGHGGESGLVKSGLWPSSSCFETDDQSVDRREA